ncbi:MAG: methyltransferase domain-containing protein [Spirochaetes bacterium]|nr:methyltransferase domain-containing protein [Spirochaetota bacterium]
MKNRNPLIFIIPQFSPRIGYGHLKRCLTLYRNLQKNYSPEILLLRKIEIKERNRFFKDRENLLSYIKKKDPSFIVLDFRYHKKNLIHRLSLMAPLILLDAIGIVPSSQRIFYINPTTPLSYRYLDESSFNYDGAEYLPVNRELLRYAHKKQNMDNNVFLSFGNSDPNKLTLKMAKQIKKINFQSTLFISIGKYFRHQYKAVLESYVKSNFKKYRIIKDQENIIPFLHQCRMLITSYGITAMEGSLLGKQTGLYNNSLYHSRLAGFRNDLFHLGTHPYTVNSVLKKRLLAFINEEPKKLPVTPEKNYNDLTVLFKQAGKKVIIRRPVEKQICPSCLRNCSRLILNQIEKQIYHCTYCKTNFLIIHQKRKEKRIYNHSYFNKEYKEQYGRTYLEDRQNISKLSDERLKIIEKYLRGIKKGKKLLDIGCAYGFFLDRARKRGFNVKGIEIEKNAVTFIKKELKIEAVCGNFLEYPLQDKFDVISLWYVLEHFKDPQTIITKIKKLLKKEGMLCFSVPNGNGPFYWYNRRGWLKAHPDDHYVDYSVRGLKILLKRNGFKLHYKKKTGFHPERYLNAPRVLLSFIKLFKTGDTMELYFRRK